MVEEATDRVKVIDKELKAMGGTHSFHCSRMPSLPTGLMGKDVFLGELAKIQEMIGAGERDIAKTKLEGEKLVKQMEFALSRDEERIKQQLHFNKTKLLELQYLYNEKKNHLMGFLETNRPFDLESYLVKKHQLLDEKLLLLKEIRLWEAGAIPAGRGGE